MANAQIGEIKSRIKSVKSTMQITKAMELVATSKLRKAKQRVESSRQFNGILTRTICGIKDRLGDAESVYLKESGVKKTCYVVFGGDRGLAGGYNVNVFKLFKTLSEGEDCTVLPIGKKALEYYEKNGAEILSDSFSSVAAIGIGDCQTIGQLLCKGFKNREYDRVVLVYTDFVSMLSQVPKSITVLPFSSSADDDADGADDKGNANQGSKSKADGSDEKKNLAGFMFDDDPEKLLMSIVPQYVGGVVYSALCESAVSEYGARRTAMDSANKNAGEFIDDLVLKYNRARQAIITQEITEIVSGSEAL